MNWTKYILRGTLLLLIVLLLINVVRKTNNNMGRIVKFKLDTLNKIKSDSLDTEHKLDLLVNKSTEFTGQIMDETPQLKEGMRYLIGAIVLLIVFELSFFIAERRKARE
jgi:hypothetical protein